jgi:hypothetical protein
MEHHERLREVCVARPRHVGQQLHRRREQYRREEAMQMTTFHAPSPAQLRGAADALDERADYLGFRERSPAQGGRQQDLRAVAAWLRQLPATAAPPG